MTTQEPGTPVPTAAPLEVPKRALDVDLAQAFSQLLFRASLLQRLRDDEARAARAAQRDLLGLLVDVDDALAALSLDPELVRLGRSSGIEATRRRLLGKLAKAGVRPMRLEGMAADPGLSEIVGTEARTGLEPETVVQSVVTGFFWNDEVLRRAQVVVATAPPPPSAEQPGPVEGVAGTGGAGSDGSATTGAPVENRASSGSSRSSGTAESSPAAESTDGAAAGPARTTGTGRAGAGARGRKNWSRSSRAKRRKR
ncbi:nucleotide exchange factor GrpE [Kitasatospora sp. DSM 101779]|uniref:nucleotide exchange factor GrpE n=1 Tax=Kitasatospora sp. DSM 101779 TaxID=2853165 RepID=UPI0021DA9B96|nr:nucleotide exchange factor GrpE [Kitasatospora sp. DSM 101779]MCU7826402.1 nucleotide exchange factor GrpE [Kitasatospora sp. DSM 101779]